MFRNEKGQFEVVKDEGGNIKNPKFNFEPEANLVTVGKEAFQNVSKTNKITVIMQKDKDSGKPNVLTVFSGDNAPMFPAQILAYNVSTMGNSQEKEFWDKNVFINLE